MEVVRGERQKAEGRRMKEEGGRGEGARRKL
jgi:hypothetical protein